MIGWLEILIVVVIAVEILFTIQVYSNYHYALKKYRRERTFRPKCVLIVPCKGLDEAFEANIRSFFEQAYKDYRLWFVVADQEDPAYAHLQRLIASCRDRSSAKEVKIWVAGRQPVKQKAAQPAVAYRRPPMRSGGCVCGSDACAGPVG